MRDTDKLNIARPKEKGPVIIKEVNGPANGIAPITPTTIPYNKNVPIASRIKGLIFRELKYRDLYPKIILMTKIKL